jgi:hypothetical protein
VAAGVGSSAAAEWHQLVTTAVLGTDRRPLPAPGAGWDSLIPADDAAVQLLNRAAAVATARRAGVQPGPCPPAMSPAPLDDRPTCPQTASDVLARLLAGQHDVLLPEWFALCESGGWQPPRHLVPTMLLRGRRNPAFDAVVRRAVGPLAAWLAEAMPELGIKVVAAPAPAGADPFAPPAPPPDSGAVVTAITQMFLDRSASWAAAAQLRIAVAAIDPEWLNAMEVELNRAPFNATTERTRVELSGLVQARRQMITALAVALPRG